MFRAWTFRAVCAGYLVVFVLAACAAGVSIWRDRSDTIDEGVKDARNIAVVLGGQIARSIQSVDIILRGLQHRFDELDVWTPSGSIHLSNLRGFRNSLLQQLVNLPQALHIVVADNRGHLVVSTADWPTPDINVADREYFKELVANDDDRLSISLPFANPITGEPAVVLARRINGPDGAFLGVVFVSVASRYFESAYGAVDLLPDQTFALMRRDGTILIRHPDTKDRAGQKIPATWPFHTVVGNGGGSYRSTGLYDQIVRWLAVNPFKEYPLVVTISVPENVMLRAWKGRATFIATGTFVFLTCALVLLSIILRHEAELRTRNQRFDAALNNMSHGLAMFDSDARLVVCNERFREMFRLSLEDVRPGRSLRDLLTHYRDCGGPCASIDDSLAETLAVVSGRNACIHEVQDLNGRILSIKHDPMPDGGWVATFEDITDRRASEAKIKLLAHNDLLTGIANRQQFQGELDTARQQLRMGGQPFTVLMLDLDRFKNVNDSLGHAAGDTLLEQTARRLEASLRGTDVLARFGGDEFAIIQTLQRDFKSVDEAIPAMRESAITLANRIIEVIGQPFNIDGQNMVIGASIGIAIAPVDGTEPDELMKRADLALYKTKSDGRNGYTFFDNTLTAAADERHQLDMDLRAGLSRNEFELYYQPEIDVATGRTCGMEALVRWHHPDQGLVMPDRFITLTEDTGLITSLGEWILQTACAEAVNWPPHVKLAINISPVQFRKPNLLDVVLCALVDSGLSPERLEIEITERVLLANDPDYLSTLHQLKNLGISIALDDFGTGNSSLGYLKMFPFDKIKIDRSYTRELSERPDCAAITCAVINLGRSLDIVTVAEGVETRAQFEALRAAGATQVQGYLFGHPLPAARLAFDATEGAAARETALSRA